MKKLHFQVAPLSPNPQRLWSMLSEREKQVALLAAQGESTREIAAELGVSVSTTQTHFKHIFAKLQIRSRVQLANIVREIVGK